MQKSKGHEKSCRFFESGRIFACSAMKDRGEDGPYRQPSFQLLFFSSEISSCFGRVGEFVFFFFFIHAVVCFIEMIIKGERLGRGMDAPAEGSGRIFGHMGQALQLLHFFPNGLYEREKRVCFMGRKKDDKFIASKSSAEGGGRGDGREDFCHVAKEEITGFMAVSIIHFFQSIQVHEKEGVGFPVVQAFGNVEYAGMVIKACEGIMISQMESGFLFLGFFCLCQDLEYVREDDRKDEYQESPGGQGLHHIDMDNTVAGGNVVLDCVQGGGTG